MDLRTRTSLFCGALALAIAVSILLRGKPRRAQLFFSAFAADIGLWYLAQWLYHFVRADVWAHFTAVLAVLLPQFALHLFEAIVPDPTRKSTLLRVAHVLLVPLSVLALSPYHARGWARVVVFLYVFGLLAVGFVTLTRRGIRSGSRATRQRVRFLVWIGALATMFSLADFLWFIGAPLPPVGAVLSIVFLFLLAESMTRERLVDLYEILGQMVVATALAFCLAGIFYVFVVHIGGFQTMYLNAVLAAIVILVLFEPLRTKVEQYIRKLLFLERVDLERAISGARRELLHVLQVDEMVGVVSAALEASRRVTAAALYLRDPHGSGYERGFSFGPPPPTRIDGATLRPLLDRLAAVPSVALETLAHQVSEARKAGNAHDVALEQSIVAATELLGPLSRGVCLAVLAEDGELLGVLIVADDRVGDAYSSEEIDLLEGLAAQIAVVVENSQQYQLLQERARLAALGQMAAGLAHEVKNPLGAIKGAAQLLHEPVGDGGDPVQAEFLEIIIEEVDRLDRVVGSVLDYARPPAGDAGVVDLNAVVRRTMQVLAPERNDCTFSEELAEELPLVRGDAEQLRQVLINLARNAVQAGSRQVGVRTRVRGDAAGRPKWVDVAVHDDGPGIAPQVVKNLFVPFFTTKAKGTGLGLAISQRMVREMGGRIEVDTGEGSGATFTLVLPVADPVSSPQPLPVEPSSDGSVQDGTVKEPTPAVV